MQITEKHINTLKELIAEFINSNSEKNTLILKEKIIKLLEKIFINSDEKKFETIIVNYVIKPLYRINNEVFSNTESKSRSVLTSQKKYKELPILLDEIFETYNSYLRNTTIFNTYQREKFDKKEFLRWLIVDDLDFSTNPKAFEQLNSSRKSIMEYFRDLKAKGSFEALNQELSIVLDKVDKIDKSLALRQNSISDFLAGLKAKKNNHEYYDIDEQIMSENELKGIKKQKSNIDELKYLLKTEFPFNTKSEINTLLKIINNNKLKEFQEIENNLIDEGYLILDDFNQTKWNKTNTELVNFCRLLHNKNFIKNILENKEKEITKVIEFFESRYNINVGTQKKPSKRNAKGTIKQLELDFKQILP